MSILYTSRTVIDPSFPSKYAKKSLSVILLDQLEYLNLVCNKAPCYHKDVYNIYRYALRILTNIIRLVRKDMRVETQCRRLKNIISGSFLSLIDQCWNADKPNILDNYLLIFVRIICCKVRRRM